MKTYHYIVDLNERGIYKAHVEDSDSFKIIWVASNQDEDDGEFWPVRDGFMKNGEDMFGLMKYLYSIGVIEIMDEIIYKD